MNRYPWLRILLAAQVMVLSLQADEREDGRPAPGLQASLPAPLGVQANLPAPLGLLRKLAFTGGSPDDAAFARVAAALPEGTSLSELSVQTALAAIRTTDRFRAVEGRLVPGLLGLTAEIRLEPWPPLERLFLKGLPRLPRLKGQMPEPRVGDRVGERGLEAWRRQYQADLVESGYPDALVACERSPEGKDLRVVVTKGEPCLISRVVFKGSLGPYAESQLLHLARIVPGKTLWVPVVRLDILARLRKRFLSDARYEGQVELAWEKGVLSLAVNAGPVVRFKAAGDGLGWNVSLKDMVPVARATRYSPELLDEGERRIIKLLRGKGYLEAQVGHRREVILQGPGGPEEVLVTYTVRHGERSTISNVAFEGNKDLPEAELRKAAALPAFVLSSRGSVATPELMDRVEARVKALYLGLGYTEATVRLQPLRRTNGRTELLFRVYEGPRRMVKWLKLDLPPGAFGDPWGLGEALALILSDRPTQLAAPPLQRRYVSEHSALAGVEGTLETREDPARGGAVVLTFTLNRSIPLLKSDLAKIFNALRQKRLPRLGIQRPVVRLALDDTADGTGVHLEVPDQPLEKVHRLVVQGSDKTRSQAVLRETQLNPGAPLDLDTLSRAQARLSYLGAFRRVDLMSLADPSEGAPSPEGPPAPWAQGDLLLHLEERSPWLVTSSFGYDESQGYHFGTGIQRLNVGGMGRTVDFGVRAGDGTIDNPTLRKWFPTGAYNNSVDSFTLGYTDPWFDPAALDGWLPDRTQLVTEGAYIQQRLALYLLRRRRILTSLQWSLAPQVSFQVGYRFERVEVVAAYDNIDGDLLSILARYPVRVIISAPYAQLSRDTRDNPLDPTRGSYSVARVELANQLFLTSPNSSFIKVDLRQQWTWPVGENAWAGVAALGMRVGVARPTASTAENLPLSERFFAGGPFTQRGVEPDGLGPLTTIPLRSTQPPYLPEPGLTQTTPLGGQGLAIINLEYRFPLMGKSVWGEVFLDSGQVYESLSHQADPAAGFSQAPVAQFPPFRTSLGFGLIFKMAMPIKVEYASDAKRILGRPRSPQEVDTQLRGLLVSAGFQF